MAVFKCKMCGGTIEFEQGATVGVCDSCGTKQTLPKLDDDRRASMYDRANHFRRNNEFDKAAGIFEQILNEDSTDAEAYWSIVLCHYGVEYVEDPQSGKRIPTVNRAQYTSIYADEDYKSAIANADIAQKALYEAEAKAIDAIQKGFLEISSKEKPFDVFISFKETGADGRRTRDAVLARELYNELTKEDFKVFFAPVTLEDKLGTAYEPYIFAALNSARVMVVLGTKPENFNAVWVRNEWSRFLALMKNGAKKTLIPAYRDMDPYDLPEEFSNLLALDMSKLGFMQDLVHGIKKICDDDALKVQPLVKETVVVQNQTAPANVAPLLERAFMFLEDGNWSSAGDYCERVLDQDPKNARAYLGKLMAELHIGKEAELENCSKSFENNDNYSKAVRFGDDRLKETLGSYVKQINERNEQNRLAAIYSKGAAAMNSADTEQKYREAAEIFQSIKSYKDSAVLAKKCVEKAESLRKDGIYDAACRLTKDVPISSLEKAEDMFQSLDGWRDSKQQIELCEDKIRQIKEKEEADRKERERREEQERLEKERAAKIWKTLVFIAVLCAGAAALWFYVISPMQHYNEALKLYDSGKYTEAIAAFETLGDYKDCTDQISRCIKEEKYQKAKALYEQKDYAGAYEIYAKITGYKDVDSIIKTDKNIAAVAHAAYIAQFTIGNTVIFGKYEQDNNSSNGKEDIEWIVLDNDGEKALLISKYALDCKQYNTSYTDVTWETCSLRKWLNDDFLNTAFSKDEQEKILSTNVTADKNPKYDIDPGKDTTDRIFLLSIPEVEEYFDTDAARECKQTKYAVSQGVYVNTDNGNCWWWLRSPGYYSSDATDVYIDGGVNYFGHYVNYNNGAVRPALWIDLES